ncbi:MAG: hypothetical protein ACRENE_01485, partial [Polyangiaceae bacterium]
AGTGLSDGQVLSVPKGGGSAVTLAGTLNSPGGFAIDATNAYWTSQGSAADCYAGGTVMKVGLRGGLPQVIASGQDQPRGVAVDAKSVYWVTDGLDDGAGAAPSGWAEPDGGGGQVIKLTPK